MKRFFLPLLISATLLCGCWKQPDVQPPSPVAPGAAIYYGAALQNNVSMTPADVAFRLFTLLGEARDLQAAGQMPSGGLDSIKVTFGGKNPQYLRTVLFGSPDNYGSIITPDDPANPTIWTIVYPSYNGEYYLPYESYYKSGTIYVDTGGKMLDEEDAQWSVSTYDGGKSKFYVYYLDKSNYYTVVNEVNFDIEDFTITNTGPDQWHIDADVSTYNTGAGVSGAVDPGPDGDPAEWIMGFSLTATPVSDAASTFGHMYGSIFTLSGGGYGSSFLLRTDSFSFDYTIKDPLTYKTSCGNKPTLSGGAIQCRLDDYNNALGYPSYVVNISLDEPTECNPTITINYNGYTETH